jgi:DNA-binding transcriptional regulator YiaG
MTAADLSGNLQARKPRPFHSNGSLSRPDALRAARLSLGMTQSRLAEVLQLAGNGSRTVRRWESGASPIPGPVAMLLTIWVEHASLRPRP